MLSERVYQQIKNRIIDSGRDTRYTLDGYTLVLSALEYHRSKSEEGGHMKAWEVVAAVSELTFMKFGPLAESVLNSFGIYTAKDVGVVVYNLIDIELLRGDDEDSLDDFVSSPPLFSTVTPSESYKINKKNINLIKDA